MAASPLCCNNHRRHQSPTQSLIFTYGTLKRGFANYPLMRELISTNDAAYVGPYVTTHAYPLVCGPYGIPFLINLPGRGHRVRGELFSVSARGLARVDELEGTSRGYYERLPIKVESLRDGDEGDGAGVVDVEAYYAHRSFGEGLWRKRGEMGISEYTVENLGDYVRRSERPKGWSFLEGVRAFANSPSSE